MTVEVKGRPKTKKQGKIEKRGKGNMKYENKWFLEQGLIRRSGKRILRMKVKFIF